MDVDVTKDASKSAGRIQSKPVKEDGHPSWKLLVTLMKN